MTQRSTVRVEEVEPLEVGELLELLAPLLERLGVSDKDVLSLTASRRQVSLRMVLRNRRGRPVLGSWARFLVPVVIGGEE